jgi:hypothetical protein
MPKNKRRRAKDNDKDPFAAASPDLAEGALNRFHRIQQRFLRDQIRDLEVER